MAIRTDNTINTKNKRTINRSLLTENMPKQKENDAQKAIRTKLTGG